MAAGCDKRRLDNFVTKERSIQMSRQTLRMILGTTTSDWFRSGEQNHAMARWGWPPAAWGVNSGGSHSPGGGNLTQVDPLLASLESLGKRLLGRSVWRSDCRGSLNPGSRRTISLCVITRVCFDYDGIRVCDDD